MDNPELGSGAKNQQIKTAPGRDEAKGRRIEKCSIQYIMKELKNQCLKRT
jgi:hypothetical protein